MKKKKRKPSEQKTAKEEISAEKKKRRLQTLLFLLVWSAILAGIYWGLGETKYTLMITQLYFVACLLLSAAYLVVSGTTSFTKGKKDGETKRMNPLGLKKEVQDKWSKLLLLLDFPLLFILLLDYMILNFIY